MVLRLADQLEVPLRERNTLLLAPGFAPTYPSAIVDDPAMAQWHGRRSTGAGGHEPFPALVDRPPLDLVAANRVVLRCDRRAPELLEPPINVLRASLHPDGMASTSSTWPSGARTSCIASAARSS